VLANTELRRIYYILLIKCCWRLISWQFWRNNANHHNEKSIFTTVSGAMLKSSGKNVDDCLLITVHSGARLKRTCSTTLPPAGITQWAVTRPQITTNDWRLTCLKTLAINMAVYQSVDCQLTAERQCRQDMNKIVGLVVQNGYPDTIWKTTMISISVLKIATALFLIVLWHFRHYYATSTFLFVWQFYMWKRFVCFCILLFMLVNSHWKDGKRNWLLQSKN